MITIKTEQEAYEGPTSFKLKGLIDFAGNKGRVQAVISTEASRKSEAVERAMAQIDSLIKYLEDSKAKLGKI